MHLVLMMVRVGMLRVLSRLTIILGNSSIDYCNRRDKAALINKLIETKLSALWERFSFCFSGYFN